MKIITINNENKKTTKLQKKKQYEIKKRRAQIGKRKESNKEIKQNERKQKSENIMDYDIDLGRFFELAATKKIYLNRLNLQVIKLKMKF